MFHRRSRSLPDASAANRLESRPAPLKGGVQVIPTRPMLQQVLDEYGLADSINDDPDLLATWDNCSVYLFHHGDRREVRRPGRRAGLSIHP